MFYAVLAAIASGATTFGGSEGVMDPKGPIAAAEWKILLNSLGIMLAIAIPTIARDARRCLLVSFVQQARTLPAKISCIPVVSRCWSGQSPP